MAATTICSDFGAPQNKVWHCFHCFPIYLPWSDGTGCHDLSYSSLNCTFMLYVLFCTFVIFQIKEVLKMTVRWPLVPNKERDKKRSLPLLVSIQDWLNPGFFFQWCNLGVTEISEWKIRESGSCQERNRTVGCFLVTLLNLQGEHTGCLPSNTTP